MKIKVCCGGSCKSRFSKYILTRIKRDIKKFDLDNIKIEEVTCMGLCDKGPNVKIDNDIVNKANGAKVSNIIFKKLKK